MLRSRNPVYSIHRILLRCTSTMSYVQRAKLLEKWKTEENSFAEAVANSKMLVFVKKEPILTRIRDHAEVHVKYEPCYTHIKEFPENIKDSAVLLGITEEGHPMCAVSVEEEPANILSNNKDSRVVSMYVAMLTLSWSNAQIVSKANSLLRWNRVYKYCPKCQDTLVRHATGTFRQCGLCSKSYYPPMYPVAITLIHNPQRTHVLLISLPRMPPGFYTCVAGFAESGESLEETLRREVAEEVGVEVRDIQPFYSQHWPFPDSSLMFGYTAVADLQEPSINEGEIRDARWFTKEELQEAFEKINKDPGIRLRALKDPEGAYKDALLVPPDGTMSYRLISHWLDTCSQQWEVNKIIY